MQNEKVFLFVGKKKKKKKAAALFKGKCLELKKMILAFVWLLWWKKMYHHFLLNGLLEHFSLLTFISP